MSTDENVAAFLVSVSQLSQERALEERQRQRDLQRDIDELRRRLKNLPPPKRPRELLQNDVSTISVIDLDEPIARTTPPKPKKTPAVITIDQVLISESIDIVKGPSTAKDKTYRSFSQIEALIKQLESTAKLDKVKSIESKADGDETSIPKQPEPNVARPLKPINKPLPTSREDRLAKHFAEAQNKLVIPMPKASYVPKGGYLNLNEKNPAPQKSVKPRKLLGNGSNGNILDISTPKHGAGWLASTLANTKTSVSHQNVVPISPPSKLPRKPNDWITSSLKNPATQIQKSPTAPAKPAKGQLLTTSDPEPNRLSPQGSPKSGQTSWINSAVRKAEAHQFDDKSAPRFLIPKSISVKSKLLLEKDLKKVEKEPEFVNMLLSLKKRTSLPPPKSIAPKEQKPQTLEFANKFEEMRKSPVRKPDLSSKIDEEIPEGLRPRLSPTRRLVPPGKPSKRPVSEFSKAEEDMLSAALSKLSLNKLEKTSESLSDRYKAQDTELLKLQILRLGKKDVEKSLLAKPEVEMEGLTALTKLKPTKKPPKMEQEKPEALKKLETMKPQKKPTASAPQETQQVNFQNHLALILRSGSTSSFGGTDSKTEPAPLRRARTDVEETKLTHPNKGRSRGPRRRLPKKTSTLESPSIIDPVRRAPPPKREKPVTVGPLAPTRKFEGDLFI